MSYSIQKQFGSLNLSGARANAFEEALRFNVQKRDIVWLERLQYDPSLRLLDIPEGWSRLESDFDDAPAHKNEKSVFYWLHHALYHGAIRRSVSAGEEAVVSIPQVDEGIWPLFIIDVAENAKVTLVDDYGLASIDTVPFRSIVVRAAQGSHVRWHGFQHHDDSLNAFDHKRFILGERAQLSLYQNLIGGKGSFDETVVELTGDRSEVFSQTVFFGHGQQHQEIRMNHVHIGRDTPSNMISKGAVQDRAHSGFLGYIQMEPGCSGADGNLEEHNLLLSNTSKIDAVPGLEIGHHDVAAAHAAYMERVDDEKLFYLASRGIPKEEAIQLIIEGFFLDAIQGMGDESLESRIFGAILNRLA